MPARCIVAGCSTTSKEHVSLHRFPKDATLRKIWSSKVKLTRAHWAGPTDTSAICSAHFDDSDFDCNLWAQFGLKKQKRLKTEAIPNIRSLIHGGQGHDDLESKRKQHRPAAEKRKRMRMLDELLGQGDNAGSRHDTAQPADDIEEDNRYAWTKLHP